MSKSGRWHRTKSHSIDPFRSVITLGISNEKLWNQGLFYRGIHIGTEDDKITSEYDWWSYGRVEVKGSKWIDLKAAPEHTSTSQTTRIFARGLLLATLRNVKESVGPILDADVRRENRQEKKRFARYIADAVRRASQKYGRDSEQYRVLKALTDAQRSKEAMQAMVRRKWAPSWETIMRLEQDQPELDPRQPRPPPRTLRRQRLLRPGPPPTSAREAAQRWRSNFRMRSILPHIIPEETDASSNTTENMASPRPTSTHRAAKPQTPRYQGEGAPSALDGTPDTKGVRSKAEGRRARPVSQARRNRPSKKYVLQSLIWW